MVNKNMIPQELRDTPRWVCWKWATKPDGKQTKVPVRARDGKPASSTNPDDWSPFQTAYNYYRSNTSTIAGVGFVFTDEDPYIGVDFDDCVTEVHGVYNVEPVEEAYLELLNSYAEVSPSGEGFKVIFKGSIPEDFARRGFKGGNGIYSSGRFFTITGNVLNEYSEITTVAPEMLDRFLRAVFPAQERGTSEWEATEERWTDSEVVRIAGRGANGDKFLALWRGDYEGAGYDNHSEADAALVEILAFYAGPVPDQIDRLFRSSGLFRDKWDEQRGNVTYAERTIGYVLGSMTEFFKGKAEEEGEMPLYQSSEAVKQDAPQPPSRKQAKKAWKRMLEGYDPIDKGEMPYHLRRIVSHLEPLGRCFVEDWLTFSTLGFFSSLWAGKKFENLPLNLWTLSISEQGTGKSVVADELDEIMHRVNHLIGVNTPLLRYSSGTASGLIRRLDGKGNAVLAYFSEWSGFAKNMESDSASNLSEVLMDLYDGRAIVHQLAQETIAVRDPHLSINAVTTPSAWARTASASDTRNGLYSRFMVCMPDVRRVGFVAYDGNKRTPIIEGLYSHIAALPEFEAVTFQAGAEGPECYQTYRRDVLRLEGDENDIIDLDDSLLMSDEENLPTGRQAARVKKVSALLELLEEKPQIKHGFLFVRDANVEKAIRIVQRGAAYAVRAYNLLSRSRDEMDAAKVRRSLEQFGTLTIMGVLRATGLNRAEAQRSLEMLQDEGVILTTMQEGRRVYFANQKGGD